MAKKQTEHLIIEQRVHIDDVEFEVEIERCGGYGGAEVLSLYMSQWSEKVLITRPHWIILQGLVDNLITRVAAIPDETYCSDEKEEDTG